jgi:hypothetical protein
MNFFYAFMAMKLNRISPRQQEGLPNVVEEGRPTSTSREGMECALLTTCEVAIGQVNHLEDSFGYTVIE